MSKISMEMYTVILNAAKGDISSQALLDARKSCFAYERDYDKIVNPKEHHDLMVQIDVHVKEMDKKGDNVTQEDKDKYEQLKERLRTCYAIKKDESQVLNPIKFDELTAQQEELTKELNEISSVSRGKLKIAEGKEGRYEEIQNLLFTINEEIMSCFADKLTENVLFSRKNMYEKIMSEIYAAGAANLEEPFMLDDVDLIDKVEKEYGISYYDVDALSATGMKKLIHSPAVYQYFMEHSQKKTKDFAVGQLLHCMVLEPDKVFNRFAVMKYSGTTKEGKEERKIAAEKGLEPINASDYEDCVKMAEAILGDPEIRKFFGNKVKRHCEVEYYVKREINDVLISCKAKADQRFIMPDGSAFLLDLKTCKDTYVTPENVASVVFKYGYHIQAAWYLEMDKICNPDNPAKNFIFVFVSKEEPHLVTTFSLSREWLLEGKKTCDEGMEIYAECVKNDYFPSGMPNTLYELPMPDYYKKSRNINIDLEEELEEEAMSM